MSGDIWPHNSCLKISPSRHVKLEAWDAIDVGDVILSLYSGLTLNQDKATKPQTVQIVRQGEATPYWFKVNPLYNSSEEICAGLRPILSRCR